MCLRRFLQALNLCRSERQWSQINYSHRKTIYVYLKGEVSKGQCIKDTHFIAYHEYNSSNLHHSVVFWPCAEYRVELIYVCSMTISPNNIEPFYESLGDTVVNHSHSDYIIQLHLNFSRNYHALQLYYWQWILRIKQMIDFHNEVVRTICIMSHLPIFWL